MAMILWGTLDAASDKTMATVTRTPSSEFRVALEELLQQIAAGIIADDPTMIEAAEQALADAIERMGLARRSDPAYPWTTLGIAGIVHRDRNGQMMFPSAQADGTPYPQVAQAIASALIALGYDLSTDSSGGAAGPGSPGQIVALGDSLTDSDAWVTEVGAQLRLPIWDLGVAGQTSTEIAFRAGALPVYMTVAGASIPGSGPVEVTAVSPGTSWRTGIAVDWSVTGWLETPSGDVYGRFYHANSTSPARFVRRESGTPVPCPAGTRFRVAPGVEEKTGAGLRRRSLIYWSGRNNISDLSVIQRDDNAVMAHFTGPKMILAVTNGTSEVSGTGGYSQIQAINSWRAATFGSAYFDVREWLVHRAIYVLGITPTQADQDAMAGDAPPPSIMADNIHFTQATSAALGDELAFQARVRGL